MVTTIEGRIDRILYRSNDGGWGTGILIDNDQNQHKIVGGILAEEGDYVQVQGDQITHPKYGDQIKIKEISVVRPKGAQGIVGYLSRLPNVGMVRAAAMYDKWGEDIFNVIETNPAALTDISGITVTISEKIHEFVAGEKVKRDLIVFLKQFDLTDNKIGRILERYGHKTRAVLKENPYRLIEDIDGFGFKTVDTIAQSAGVHRQDPKRIAAGIIHVLNESEQEGHVYLPMDELVKRAVQLLMVPQTKVLKVAQNMIGSGNLAGDGENQTVWKRSALYSEIKTCNALLSIAAGSYASNTKLFNDMEGLEDGIGQGSATGRGHGHGEQGFDHDGRTRDGKDDYSQDDVGGIQPEPI